MKLFTSLAVFVFAAISVLQLARYFQALPVTIGDTSIPVWVSLPAGLAAVVLSFMVWRENR